MPEKKVEKPPEKIEPFLDMPIKETEDMLVHQHTGKDGSPQLSERDAFGMPTGGRYLNQIEKTNTFDTAQTSFQDVTDLAITKDIHNRRVILLFSGCIKTDVAPSHARLTFDIDGTDQGGSEGLVAFRSSLANAETPVTMIYITGILIGTHTFKVELNSSGGDTTTLGATNARLIFIAIELTD